MKISSDLLKSLKELSFEAANAIMRVYSQEFISEEKKIAHEENMILPPVPQEEPQCVSTL